MFASKGHCLFSHFILITMVRQNRVRLSDQEKNIVDMTQKTMYDEDVPRGVVIERACRNLMADDSGGSDGGVVL